MTDDPQSDADEEAAGSSRPSRFRRFLDATDPATQETATSGNTADGSRAASSPDATPTDTDPSDSGEAPAHGEAPPGSSEADQPQQPGEETSQPATSSAPDQSSSPDSAPDNEQSVEEWEWLADQHDSDQSASTESPTLASTDTDASASASSDATTSDDADVDMTDRQSSSPGDTDAVSPPADAPAGSASLSADKPSTAPAETGATDTTASDAAGESASTPSDSSLESAQTDTQMTATGDEPQPDASADSTAAAGTATSDSSSRDRTARVWNSVETTTPESSVSSPDSSDAESADSPAAPTDIPDTNSTPATQDSDTAVSPTPVDVGAGESAFILCPTHSDARQQLVRGVIAAFETPPVIVVVRYRPLSEALLRELVELTHEVEVVTVGYSQSLPPGLESQVSTTHITSASDVTRLGIVVSRLVDVDRGRDRPTVFHHHAVDTLLQYRDPNTTFRFLHVLLGRLRNAGFTSHFFIDAAAVDDHAVSSLRPLFDTIVETESGD